jgi:hypothetical protein
MRCPHTYFFVRNYPDGGFAMADTEQTATKIPELKPYAVSIPVAQSLMGDKSRSEVYEARARGEVDFVKDGKKTLVVLASIERRQAALPVATMVEPPELQRASKRRSKRPKARA